MRIIRARMNNVSLKWFQRSSTRRTKMKSNEESERHAKIRYKIGNAVCTFWEVSSSYDGCVHNNNNNKLINSTNGMKKIKGRRRKTARACVCECLVFFIFHLPKGNEGASGVHSIGSLALNILKLVVFIFVAIDIRCDFRFPFDRNLAYLITASM